MKDIRLSDKYWIAVVSLILFGFGFSSVESQAQDVIPFVHEIIDPSPPFQSHCKTVGDIDGDGFPDALVASARQGSGFYWYRYPDWTKHTIVPPGTGFTTDMQVADIDADGDLDAVVPKGWNKGASVFWYENPRPEGDPATDPWTEHAIGVAASHDVEVGDVNNDGKIDVVVRNDTLTVFFQETPTSWIPNQLSTRPKEGTSLGDIDNDGDLDIAINGYWLENPLPNLDPMTTAWTEHTITSSWPDQSGVLITDLNEDGRADVVLSPSEVTGRFSWFEGPTSPTSGVWVERQIDPSAHYYHTFKAADMDLDGDLDLVTAEMEQSSDPDEVSVYLNQGGALSWTQQVVATTGSHNLRVADIGSDGDMDIVGINWSGSTPFEVWHNQLNPMHSLGQWERHVIDPGKPWRAVFIDAGDVNGDALPDILTGGWWYQNPGMAGGSWTRNDLGTPLRNMAAVHDFDGDGHLDVLGTEGIGAAANPDFVWARNDGQGSFTVLENIESGVGDFLQGVAVDVFQNSGPTEVVLSWHAGSGGVQRLTLPTDPVNQTWAWSEVSPTTQDEQLSAADIDRDGDTDLLLGTIWLRNDGASWSSHAIATTTSLPDRNVLVDVNNDGLLDAVVGFEAESRLSWFEQGTTATALWTEHSISSDFFAPMSLDAADMDGDGDVDVVAGEHNLSSPASARLFVFENINDGGDWTTHHVYTGDEHHDGARLVDIDNDGDLDIISIGWSHGRVLLYENKSASAGTQTSVDYNPDWNLLSVPLQTTDMSVNSLFPAAVSSAFVYSEGYAAEDPLSTGVGFWMKFDEGGSRSLTGQPTLVQDVAVSADWNVVGAFDQTVPVGSITSTPEGIIESDYFGYDGGYYVATDLEFGQGYWVKATQPGTLHLSVAGKQRASQHERPLDGWPALEFRDGSRGRASLYLYPSLDAEGTFGLPPKPPMGVFDVRFSDDTYATSMVDGERQVSIASAAFPITVTAKDLGQKTLVVTDAITGNLFAATLADEESITIPKGFERLVLRLDSSLPTQYTLDQNYPNPFNPSTEIRFSLPRTQRVGLHVYDVLGRRVLSLVDGDVAAGNHRVSMDGSDLASGVYIYRLTAGDFTSVKRMMLVR